ncbi:DUF2946 family protein [Stenotrophomonas sp. GZD-301]|uniref:DUF2946 family protein n=1 Tax=Stenotrophomonas sp. GZD-301 TaxID=3404814 RepID=UPI003BB6ADDF
MFRRARPRPSLLLRLLMLVAVGLGVFGSATASALADIHISLHADAAHLADDAAADGPDHDGNDLLHTLVHCGHCHGHGGVLPMAALPWTLPSAPPHALPSSLTAQLRTQPPESLLRPPIAV